VRLELINPLFKALGWNIGSKQGYAKATTISEAEGMGYGEQLDKI